MLLQRFTVVEHNGRKDGRQNKKKTNVPQKLCDISITDDGNIKRKAEDKKCWQNRLSPTCHLAENR